MLIDGEIDLMSDLSYTPERNAPIALIGYSDYYFAVNKSEPELLVELNSAMRRIQSEEADYNSKLKEKHIQAINANAFLSTGKIDWLDSHGTIRAGYQDGYPAFCARNPETGKLTGTLKSKPLFTETLTRCVRNILTRREQNTMSAPEQVNMRDSPASAGLAGSIVLAAEDMELNAEILIELLDMEEIRSEYAENGQVAVDMFSERPVDCYDAILMDVRMPIMDGLEATCAIRSLSRSDAKSIPIIAMTANAFDEDVRRSLQAGMNVRLSKPVEPERLYDTLKQAIQSGDGNFAH